MFQQFSTKIGFFLLKSNLRPLGPTKWCQLLTNNHGIGTLIKRLRLGPSKQTGQYLLTRCAFSLGIPEAVADRYPDAEQLG